MHLEGNLSSLVLGDRALALVEATGTTTATAEAATATATTTTATAATATEATAAAAATETATATTTATAIVVLTGSAEVQTDGTTLKLGTVELVVGSASLVNGRVLNVAEALGAARLGVSGQTDAENGTLSAEELTNGVLVSAEGKVTDEQGVALRAGLVAKVTGTVLSTVAGSTLVVGGTASGIVEVDGAAIDLSALLGLESLSSISSVGELNVTETRIHD
ncbi:hypothetical protein BO82DRAFT_125945 [Aspergillus uvarum CBS 121591]|uniref:Uncharacterized protein n=1 Tax=Aspergillus uvarum CBS 121591 TaxID=1448315 RepID=A0A319C0Z3_9EURO|nr:hypothetical protein BO82DRAFT_125945 [Aspergillus uvarum CBS 121591]PYH79696.1 hypothetical protein BO82DRAFT_125945 [Aspergillus uvarum CBS 121591]